MMPEWLTCWEVNNNPSFDLFGISDIFLFVLEPLFSQGFAAMKLRFTGYFWPFSGNKDHLKWGFGFPILVKHHTSLLGPRWCFKALKGDAPAPRYQPLWCRSLDGRTSKYHCSECPTTLQHWCHVGILVCESLGTLKKTLGTQSWPGDFTSKTWFSWGSRNQI